MVGGVKGMYRVVSGCIKELNEMPWFGMKLKTGICADLEILIFHHLL